MCLMLEPGSKFGFNPGRAPRFAARTLRTLELQTLRCVVMAGRLAGTLGGAADCKVICFVGAFLRLCVLPCCGFMISALHLLRSKTKFKNWNQLSGEGTKACCRASALPYPP